MIRHSFRVLIFQLFHLRLVHACRLAICSFDPAHQIPYTSPRAENPWYPVIDQQSLKDVGPESIKSRCCDSQPVKCPYRALLPRPSALRTLCGFRSCMATLGLNSFPWIRYCKLCPNTYSDLHEHADCRYLPLLCFCMSEIKSRHLLWLEICGVESLITAELRIALCV